MKKNDESLPMANRPMIDAGGWGPGRAGAMDGGRIPFAPKLSAERSIEVRWLRAESGRVGARFGRSTLGRFVPTLADIYVQMQRVHIHYTIQGRAVFLH